VNDEVFEWVENLLTDALGGSKISEWERSFLSDQKQRLDQYGRDTRFSVKQFGILDRVAAKLDYPERPAEGAIGGK